MTNPSMQLLVKNSALSGGNIAYLEDLYEQFLKNPESLAPEWRTYFQQLPRVSAVTVDVSHADIVANFAQLAQKTHRSVLSATLSSDVQFECQKMALQTLIAAYRADGHLIANINPIALNQTPLPDNLRLDHYPALASAHQTSFEFAEKKITLNEILTQLKTIYGSTVGAEFMYLSDPQERAWIIQRLEKLPEATLSSAEKIDLLKQLVAADGLEKYLGSKYVGQKRFSLEGGDGFIPLTHAIYEAAAKNGVEEVVMGMAHRGRLNTLINLFGKPPAELFAQFEGKKDYGMTSGDVKYHMGYASDIQTPTGQLHLSLAFNPSHLEVIAPVLMGSVRARQQRRPAEQMQQVLALVVHGDASFSGQGVIMESLQMSQTHAYCIGGAIHIIINNQVGFTTSDSQDARSSRYCTDVAKMIDCPVFHVNGDDPEALVWIARLAADYRAKFHKDVFIDLVCYRRLGHNEADEPSMTQPLMYQRIRQHPVPREIYANRLVAENVCTNEAVDAMVIAYRDALDAQKSVIETLPHGLSHRYASDWKPYAHQEWTAQIDATVPQKKLKTLAEKMEILPDGFEVQRQVGHILAARAQMTAGELPIDWGYAETLAYATLVDAGYSVRMSGQDCRRGTFSHRHAVLHDQKTDQIHTPLCHISADQAAFQIYDSLLSEMGVMGFEYGYASTEPNSLVIWEAQYGDFANGAQMLIDQFISSAWQKWGTLSGLTLLLPHGYEGAGPEHTSARLERFLQLSAQENIQVCMPTTPAQIYHLLRRQVIRPYRTPLIVMTPKSLLRSKLATSTLAELSEGQFQLVMPDTDPTSVDKVKRVILCSGKVYYELLTKREEENNKSVAIIRIEQLYPFPHEALCETLKQYMQVKDIVWCQEEPENQGAWYTTRHRLEACLNADQTVRYVGRPAAASPAAGYAALHAKQQAELVQKAFEFPSAQKR